MKTITISDKDLVKYIECKFSELTGYKWMPDENADGHSIKMKLLNQIAKGIEENETRIKEHIERRDALDDLHRIVDKEYDT